MTGVLLGDNVGLWHLSVAREKYMIQTGQWVKEQIKEKGRRTLPRNPLWIGFKNGLCVGYLEQDPDRLAGRRSSPCNPCLSGWGRRIVVCQADLLTRRVYR